MTRVVRTLQATLEALYDVQCPARVEHYLIDQPEMARDLDPLGHEVDEKLLIHEGRADVAMCLYIAPQVVRKLEDHNPLVALSDANLGAFCSALEGVSHLTYAACNAAIDKPVTLLEMELQAEVDKFVVATLLLRRQIKKPQHFALMRRMFGRLQLCDTLGRRDVERYAHANDAAARFCGRVMRPHRRASQRLADLRRFYRMPKLAKLAAC